MDIEAGSDSLHLPARTAEVLKNIEDEDVQRELRELIILAVAFRAKNELIDAMRVTAMVDELLSIGQRLDTAVARADEHDTVGIHHDLERLEHSDDAEDEESLSERRAKLLEALDKHDRAVSEVTVLRCALQRCRGAFLDLISRDTALDVARGEIMRDLEDSMADTLLDVESKLDAVAEVERL